MTFYKVPVLYKQYFEHFKFRQKRPTSDGIRKKEEKMYYPRTVVGILFPCPSCGHRNRVSKKLRQSVQLWLENKLPLCKKCGFDLKRANYDFIKKMPQINRIVESLK